MTIATRMAVHTGKPVRRGLGLVALAVAAAFVAAPAALADAGDPAPPPAPVVLPTDAPAPAPGPAAGSGAATPVSTADGIPHLTSPDNLPPGTTDTPTQTRSLGYLRDIIHAIGNHDVTMSDALLLLAQRPMSSTASPGQSAAPSGPVGSSAAVAPAAADAPVAAPPTP